MVNSGDKEKGVSILKLEPSISDSGAEKISLAASELSDDGFVVTWASHVPLPEKAWRTDWKRFDENGVPKAEGFDWVPYPSRIIRTVASSATSGGFVLASIVENEPGMAPEVYVHEVGRNTGQLDPGSIAFPGLLSLGEISLLALEPVGLALAVIGTDSALRPALWVGRYDGNGKLNGTRFIRSIPNGDSVSKLEEVRILPTPNGGWVCYWNESQENGKSTINGLAFGDEGVGIPNRRSTGDCGSSLCVGTYPAIPYGDGKILVATNGISPTKTFIFDPDGDSLSHPDLLESLHTSMPVVPVNAQDKTFLTLASNVAVSSLEIHLLDSTLSLVQRKTVPGVFKGDIALCRTTSGKIALISREAPYASTSALGLLLMDPHWD